MKKHSCASQPMKHTQAVYQGINHKMNLWPVLLYQTVYGRRLTVVLAVQYCNVLTNPQTVSEYSCSLY